MFKKFASLVLIAALVCILCGSPAFAQTSSQPDAGSNRISDTPESESAGKKVARADGSLKAGIQKLVADARAGKWLAVSDPQNQPKQSNSLSKTTKIALVVGIAAAVILIIVFVHARNHFFDDARIFQ